MSVSTEAGALHYDVMVGSAESVPAARRLQLSSAAVRWLAAQLPGELPPMLATTLSARSALSGEELIETNPVAELTDCGVVSTASDERPHVVAPVRLTWAVLTSPRQAIDLSVTGRGVGRRAFLGLHDSYGAGLVQLAEDTWELSAWTRHSLRSELTRLVPPPEQLRPRPSIMEALSGSSRERGPGNRWTVDLTAGESSLPAPNGRLDVKVIVATDARPAAGQVHWACAGGGWWRIRAAGPVVLAEPVEAADLVIDVTRLITAAATWLPRPAATTMSTPTPAAAPEQLDADINAGPREVPGA